MAVRSQEHLGNVAVLLAEQQGILQLLMADRAEFLWDAVFVAIKARVLGGKRPRQGPGCRGRYGVHLAGERQWPGRF